MGSPPNTDMIKLTEIYNKSFGPKDKKTGERECFKIDLSLEELRFIYALDKPIEGFGNGDDPRIYEIIKGRGVTSLIQEDVAMIFHYFGKQDVADDKYDKYDYLTDLLAGRKTKGNNNYPEPRDDGEPYEENGLTHTGIVKLLLECVPREYWKDILKHSGHSQAVLDILMEQHGADAIMANWEEVSTDVGVDKLTKFLIEHGGGDTVMANLEKIRAKVGVDRLTTLFIDNRESWRIISNLEKFYKPAEYYSIIERVLKHHDANGCLVGDRSIEIIMKIDESIISIPNKAKLLIENHFGNYIFRYWDKFKILDQNKLVKSLVEHEAGFDAAYNMAKFDHLNNDVIQLLFTDLVVNKRRNYNGSIQTYLYSVSNKHVIKTQTAKILVDGLNEFALRYIERYLDSFEHPLEVRKLLEEKQKI